MNIRLVNPQQNTLQTLSRRPLANAVNRILICSALALPLSMPFAAVYAEAAEQHISLSAGNLSTVLTHFASETGAVVYFDANLTRGKETAGLEGAYSVMDGLTKLLSGSGLQAVKENDGSYRVIDPAAGDQVMTLKPVRVSDSSLNSVTEGTGSYTIQSMNTATKMKLNVIDTPQSVSVVTAEKIDNFNLTSINKVLESTVGITVEKMESDRTQFTARGFEVTNFLIDGVSLPLNYSYQYGDIDMALYDHVEITRGATGLTTANGDPSATINLVRKRPTDEFQASVGVALGSWEYKRADVDVSGALNASKSVRGRAILALEDSASYLDRYETASNLMSFIVEADVSNNTVLTAGLTRYEDNNAGTQWGGIPAFDGVDYDVSTNAASDWSYRDVVTTDVSLEVDTNLNDDWQLKATYAYKNIDQDANLINLWVNDDVLQIDGSQDYQLSSKEQLLNVTLEGVYSLFGRDNEIVVGLDVAKRDVKENSRYDQDMLGTAIDLTTWDGSTQPPVFDDRVDGTDYKEEQTALFFASNTHLLENLSVLLGARVSTWAIDGSGYWESNMTSEDDGVFTPYAALLYKNTDNVSTYASYTTTFKPQSYIDENASYLDPAEGVNYEVGIKALMLDGKLNTSFAYFTTSQDGVAEWGGSLEDGSGRTYYTAEDGIETQGFELEVTGSLTHNVEASLGYTSLTTEDSKGEAAQTYIPTETLKASIMYDPAFVSDLRVGASLNWKDATRISAWYGDAKQDAYAVLNLTANYQVSEQLQLSVNVDNLTDEKYYGSLIKPYVTFGEPRSIKASMSYQF